MMVETVAHVSMKPRVRTVVKEMVWKYLGMK